MPDEPDNRRSNADERPSFSTGRRFGSGLSALISVTALLAIVVMVNYLAVRHFHRYHFGSQTRPPLSPESLGVLRGLTNDVRVVILFDRDESLYPDVSALLSEYHHASPRLRLEYVDYVRDADTARLIK